MRRGLKYLLQLLLPASFVLVEFVSSLAEIRYQDIDKTVLPIVDLNEFANGKFAQNNPLIGDEVERSVSTMMEKEIDKQLIELLTERSQHVEKYDPDSVDAQLGRFWKSAMDDKPSLDVTLRSYMERIDEIQSFEEYQRQLAELHQLQIFSLFALADPHLTKKEIEANEKLRSIRINLKIDMNEKHDTSEKLDTIEVPKEKYEQVMQSEWSVYFDTLSPDPVHFVAFTTNLWSFSALAFIVDMDLSDAKEQLKLDLSGHFKDYFADPSPAKMLHILKEGAPQSLSKLYCQIFSDPSIYDTVKEMVYNTKFTLKSRIRKLHWMSETTKEKAMRKLDKMRLNLGCPERFNKLEDVQFLSSSFFDNLIELKKAKHSAFLRKLSSFDANRWAPTTFTVNAFYDRHTNTIELPLAILQPPTFNSSSDMAENYGALGYIIGHEMTHGFDVDGVLYDEYGNYDPWLGEDTEKYSLMREKAISQFNGYRVLTKPVNGEKTVNENFADIGGLQLAYHALRKHYEAHGREPTQHGHSPEQRFFIAFAQWHAATMSDKQQLNLLQNGHHSPNEIRAKCVPRNLAEFAQAFDGTLSFENCIRPWDTLASESEHLSAREQLYMAEKLLGEGKFNEALAQLDLYPFKHDPSYMELCAKIRNGKGENLLKQMEDFEIREHFQQALDLLNHHEADVLETINADIASNLRECYEAAAAASQCIHNDDFISAIALLDRPQLRNLNCAQPFFVRIREAYAEKIRSQLFAEFHHLNERVVQTTSESEALHNLQEACALVSSKESFFVNTRLWETYVKSNKTIHAMMIIVQFELALKEENWDDMRSLLAEFETQNYGLYLLKKKRERLGVVFETLARHWLSKKNYPDALTALNVPAISYSESATQLKADITNTLQAQLESVQPNLRKRVGGSAEEVPRSKKTRFNRSYSLPKHN